MAQLGNITFYAEDPDRLARFWAGVFGYPPPDLDGFAEFMATQGLSREEVEKRSMVEDPEGCGPRLYFHHAAGPKDGRNRIHLDVNLGSQHRDLAELEAEKDRLVGLGATVVRLVDQRWGEAHEQYFQLQDPEGNEFCLQ